ncbi:MAG: RusA family crossover junction endodeoxyribonuclease [Desulfurispora sp.]|uniref:RusA family crossover junction endodeoxyribonuclease n=1 Tax=Desulfurispora sp. TaxID=3014275 RepID=UPI00404AB32D
MQRITITVPGRPVPKQRPRLGRNGYVYTPERSHDYEKHIHWLARKYCRRPCRGPVSLSLTVYLASPGGDLDNYVKAVCDGLNRAAYVDDRQVRHIQASLVIAPDVEERAEIILECEEEEYA